MALMDHDRVNFETLSRAFAGGDVALVQATRISDGREVALVAAIGKDGGEFTITPFAVMIEGNPFELFEDPTAEVA